MMALLLRRYGEVVRVCSRKWSTPLGGVDPGQHVARPVHVLVLWGARASFRHHAAPDARLPLPGVALCCSTARISGVALSPC
jgi:hypothetical protein